MKRHHREESSSRAKKGHAPSVSDGEDNNGYVNSSKKHKSPPRKALLRRPSREDRPTVDKHDHHNSRQTFLLRPNPSKFVGGNTSSRSFNPLSGHPSSRKSYAPSSRMSSHSSRSLIHPSGRVNPMLAASLASSGKLPNLPLPTGSSGGSAATVAAVAAAAMNAAAMAAALGAGGVISSKQMSHITKALASATRTSRDRRHDSTSNRPVRRSPDRFINDDSRSSRKPRGGSKEKDLVSIFNARYARPVEHRNPEDDPHATRTLFLGNLPPDVEEPELRKLFERYGIIEDIDIKRRELENGATAFAFVRYLSLDMAHRAKVNLSGQMIGEYRFKIGYGKVIPTRCLWVGGLGPWTNYPEFATLVNSISSPEKIIWPSGKNYAHILYSNSELAAVAADLLRGYPLGSSHRRIRVDFTDESHMFKDPNWKRLKRDSSTESNSRHYSSRRSLTPRTRRDTSHSDNAYSHGNNHSKYRRDRRSYDESDRSRSVSSSHHKRESLHRSRKATYERTSRRNQRDHSVTPEADSSRNGSRSRSSSRSREGSSSPSTPPTLDTSTNIGQLASCLPKAWVGAFYLKSSSFQCRMHVLRGDKSLVDQFMYRGLNSEASADQNDNRRTTKKSNKDKHTSVDEIDSSESHDGAHDSNESDYASKDKVVCLRITQRMRLDPVKLDDVNQRVEAVGPSGYCILLAVPTRSVRCHENEKQPQRPLRNLVGYLRTKDSAGVVLLNSTGQNQNNDSASPSTTEATNTSGVLYAFPPCDFSLSLLHESAPRLEKDYGKDDHLVILLIRGTGVV